MSSYMKISGIKGDATYNKASAENYTGCCELLAYNFDTGNAHTDTGSNSHHAIQSRVAFKPFEVIKYVDSASPTILNYLNNQKVIPSVTIISAHSSGKYLSYELQNVKFIERKFAADSDAGATEIIRMSYDSIREEYYPRDKKNNAMPMTLAQIRLTH